MKFETTKIKTRTYKLGYEDYMIDIVETDAYYNAWIYTGDRCSLKSFAFGREKNGITINEFKRILGRVLDRHLMTFGDLQFH